MSIIYNTPIKSSFHIATLTILIPAYNEGKAISQVLQEIDQYLANLKNIKCTILVVDDGSRDDTALKAYGAPCRTSVEVLRLSRNFGKEAAMTAGLQNVETDAAVIMDADGQHPPEMITSFVQQAALGYDIVYARRSSRATDSWLRRTLSVFYYKVILQNNPFIEPNAGDFRLMTRPVIDALNSLPERNRFMKGLFNWVGFKKFALDYEPRQRVADHSKFSFLSLFRFGLLGIVSFSTVPLRFISLLGFCVAALAMFYGFFTAIRTLVFGIDTPGWATLTVGMMLLSGIQLIAIGVVGEYIGQIFTEVKNRPAYIIAEKLKNSRGAVRQAA